jgi:Holliday junction resolvase RusA-like endonuclease
MQVGAYRNLNIKGYFEIHLRVFYPAMRQDLDNSLKVVLDCLQHTKTIENDNKCVKIVAEKFIDKENPRIEFKLVTIE